LILRAVRSEEEPATKMRVFGCRDVVNEDSFRVAIREALSRPVKIFLFNGTDVLRFG
jgi:hypothetical protein